MTKDEVAEIIGFVPDIYYIDVWNAAIEKAALTSIANGDRLEIHSPRIASAIRALKVK
jgi:hypothetical protein